MVPGYIIVWHIPASRGRRNCTEFNSSTVKVISWYLPPDAPVSRLTAGLKVNMLHLFPAGSPMLSCYKSFNYLIAWHSLHVTHQTYISAMKHSPGIHTFRPACYCLIVEPNFLSHFIIVKVSDLSRSRPEDPHFNSFNTKV